MKPGKNNILLGSRVITSLLSRIKVTAEHHGHTQSHTHTHTHTQHTTHTHTHTQHTHTHTHTQSHKYTHTSTHKHRSTYTHTHTHSLSLTHLSIQSSLFFLKILLRGPLAEPGADPGPQLGEARALCRTCGGTVRGGGLCLALDDCGQTSGPKSSAADEDKSADHAEE